MGRYTGFKNLPWQGNSKPLTDHLLHLDGSPYGSRLWMRWCWMPSVKASIICNGVMSLIEASITNLDHLFTYAAINSVGSVIAFALPTAMLSKSLLSLPVTAVIDTRSGKISDMHARNTVMQQCDLLYNSGFVVPFVPTIAGIMLGFNPVKVMEYLEAPLVCGAVPAMYWGGKLQHKLAHGLWAITTRPQGIKPMSTSSDVSPH